VTAGRRLAALLALATLALALAAPAGAQQAPIVRPANDRAPLQLELGAQLYAANCVTCHGIDGRGNGSPGPDQGATTMEGLGPPLRDVGALAADFYTRTGYMPLHSSRDQPVRSRVLFSERERLAIVRYVASLGSGPPVPTPHPELGDVAVGRELFTEHCAGCHQVVAEGGVVTGAKAPPLNAASPVEVAEAVRIGPYVMPKFSEKDIDDQELDAIIAYVQYAKDPEDAGGWGINHLGPFPEGMVTWLIAAVVLVMTCMAIGKRIKE
jgi:ubiquinol-cytochrome c reductase cytochrome c subunit